MSVDPVKAREFVVLHEGLSQPHEWPGGGSGITLGRGFDLAHATEFEFRKTWKPYLDPDQINRLSRAIGVSGQAARKLAPKFKDIAITTAAADAVFATVMLPRYEAQARQAFPGMDKLPERAQVALISLVFNRGPSITDNARRIEMRAINQILSDGVQKGDLAAIAHQIRSMKRLWMDMGLDGLPQRREEEAQAVESCIPNP